MSIQLTVVGQTIAECYTALGLADAKTSTATTEELVEELRRRLRLQGMVLNIDQVQEPAEEGQFGDEPEANAATPAQATEPAPEKDKPKRGRPRNPPKETNGAAVPASAATAASPGATREDVIAALNAFSEARGGQVAARQAMQEACGVARLVDVKPEDYGKLLAHLKG